MKTQKFNEFNEHQIRIETGDDHQFWSDVYKNETGFRPRMKKSELEKWARETFVIKNNEYVRKDSLQ